MILYQLVMQLISGKQCIGSSIPFHVFFQIKEEIIEDVGASLVRIIKDNGLSGDTAHLLDQSLPLFGVWQKTEGHDHIKLIVLEGKIQTVACHILKTAWGARAVQARPADISASGNGYFMAVVCQRHGQLRMATPYIQY